MTRDEARYRLPPGPADRSRFFIPEHLTALYHTPGYAGLSEEKRRRYNHYAALYLNEMFVFFEDVLAETVLGALLSGPLPAGLAERLEAFRWEERRHTEMFHALNKAAAPELYAGGEFRFIRASGAARALLDAAARRPRLFPMFFWIMLLQEDRSLYYSREVLKDKDALEPRFVHVHRVHMADEAGHVKADDELLALFWAPVPAFWRRVNARLLRWVLAEFFTAPRRAGPRVIRAWASEFPDEAARLPYWLSALEDLEHSPEFQASLYSRAVVPAAFAGFDRWPELEGMAAAMPAYAPEKA
ncbi:MAG: Uncharacterized protein FD126_1384 [Elusimicrobia bacterium]|nr:MAG: Uncharacterized protein FD126_1384 [Elusimicrobiota bacterium]